MKLLKSVAGVFALILACLLSMPAVAGKAKLSNVSVENQDGNVLRKSIAFTSKTQGKVQVHWWEAGTNENAGRHTEAQPWQDTNKVVINYLKANTTYLWSVHVLVGDGVVNVSKPQKFTTDALPDGGGDRRHGEPVAHTQHG